MNGDRIKALHFALCYMCFTELHTVADWGEDGFLSLENMRLDPKTLQCKKCGSPLSLSHLMSIQIIARAIERDFVKWLGFQPEYVAWSKNEGLIDRFGPHYKMAHGWEPYFTFILVSALAGIIGNASYEYISKLVKTLFKRCFPGDSTIINLDNHLDFVLRYYRGETSEFTGKTSKWSVKTEVDITIKALVDPSKQESLDQVLKELKESFKKIATDIPGSRGQHGDSLDSFLTNNKEK